MVMSCYLSMFVIVFFSSRRRHTRCALVTGVQTVLFRSKVANDALQPVEQACALSGTKDRNIAGRLDIAEHEALLAKALGGDRDHTVGVTALATVAAEPGPLETRALPLLADTAFIVAEAVRLHLQTTDLDDQPGSGRRTRVPE